MIKFYYQDTNFKISNSDTLTRWISLVIKAESHKEGHIDYIFCSDNYLHLLNVKFLNHNTFTDIISFDNSIDKTLNGEIYISTERVIDNAKTFNVSFKNEMLRVIIHGILHFCGYGDKSDEEIKTMRAKEDFYIAQYH